MKTYLVDLKTTNPWLRAGQEFDNPTKAIRAAERVTATTFCGERIIAVKVFGSAGNVVWARKVKVTTR